MNLYTNGQYYILANSLDEANGVAEYERLDFIYNDWSICDDDDVIEVVDRTGLWRMLLGFQGEIHIPENAEIIVAATAKEWSESATIPVLLCDDIEEEDGE